MRFLVFSLCLLLAACQLAVFASLIKYPSVSLSLKLLFDNQATSTNGSADFDGTGASFDSQFLPTGAWLFDGISYDLPIEWGIGNDNIIANSQNLSLANATFVHELHFLYAGDASGNAFVKNFVLHFDDDSAQTVQLVTNNWWHWPLLNWGTIRTPYHFEKNGGSKNLNSTQIFQWSTSVSSERSLKSITFPANTAGRRLHIFAVAVSPSVSPSPTTPRPVFSIRRARFTSRWEMVNSERAQAIEVTIANILPNIVQSRATSITAEHSIIITGPGITTVRSGSVYRLVPGDQVRVDVFVIGSQTDKKASVQVKDSKGAVVGTSEGWAMTLLIEKWTEDVDVLSQHETPAWFNKAKFGIFIHWGVYSFPAWNLRKRAAIEYQPIQIKKVQQLLRALLATPEDFYEHNKTASVGITMASVYGYDVAPVKDHFVEVADEAMGISGKYIPPSAAAVNIFPWLRYVPKWFPGAGWKTIAEEISKLTLEMLEGPMNYTKKTLKEGTASKSLVSELLENNEARAGVKDLSERDIKAIAATIYGGASDTTISSTLTFFFAMTLNLDVQRKAQEEIERVIGTDRLPTYEDRASLPYIEAMYREVMRWRPPLPLGVPHLATDADIYKGYYVPRGAVIVPNIWAMTHDETVYNDPERFYPDRYFDQDGSLNNDDEVLAFGFGRRKCVGKYMASSTVWLVIVSVLATFDIKKAKDVAGNDVEIDDKYTDNAISLKLPFKCAISPRSVDARRLVEETMEAI